MNLATFLQKRPCRLRRTTLFDAALKTFFLNLQILQFLQWILLLFPNTTVFTMNYALFSSTNIFFSKTHAFTYTKHTFLCLFFKNHSFYYELCTVWLGAILRPFWHRAGPVAEQSRAEPSRAGPSRAGPSWAEPSRASPGPQTQFCATRLFIQK